MKRFYKIIFILITLFIFSACNKDSNYEILVNESIATEIYLGETIDFKEFFIVKDKDGKLIEIKDEMIDSSDVDLNKEGKYIIKLIYEGKEKELEISIIKRSIKICTITINEEVSTIINLGDTSFDFKQFFTIKDSDGNTIEVLDSMIDKSKVDFNKEGKYIVKIEFEGVEKEITVDVVKEDTEPTYEIQINDSLPTVFELGITDIDFKKYFTIKDSNNNTIEVLDSMINIENVNLSKVGRFKISIKYMGESKELEFQIVLPSKMYATDLFISEYVEARDYDKYIEIFNGTGKDIDLSSYSLKLFNDSKSPAQYKLDLTGTIKDGDVFVIYNPNARSLIKNVGDIADIVISFNGNDVIALYKDDVLIDVVGDLNNPKSVGWDIGNIKEATKDHTLVRKSNVFGPSSSWKEEEWLVLNLEDFSNINIHSMDNYEVPKEDEEERVVDLFISEYFEGDGEFKDSKYIEIYNPLGVDVNLEDYSLAVYKNGEEEASFVQPLSGVLSKNSVYVVYAPYSQESIKNKGNLASEVCYFNGKAAIALLKNEKVIDVIGVIGEYPVEGGWIVVDHSTTANNTIIRKETINSPTSKWNPEEWYACYENYLYDLGNHYQIDNEDMVYEDFTFVFNMFKNLELDNKGTAQSEKQIKVKGTVFMDVVSETTLVYLTDGRYFIKLHGEKIHNYTAPGMVYEITCYYQAYQYIPTLEVVNPANDIMRVTDAEAVSEIEVLEVTLEEILALKKENFALNITNGYLQSMLKVKGYLHLDTHNSSKYDYALTINETYTKNDTGYINNGLYFKNDVEELVDVLIDYQVVKNGENVEIDIFGVIYDWNPNRKNWRIYVSDELTYFNLDLE